MARFQNSLAVQLKVAQEPYTLPIRPASGELKRKLVTVSVGYFARIFFPNDYKNLSDTLAPSLSEYRR